MRSILRRLLGDRRQSHLSNLDPIHEENYGVNLGEWEPRARQAVVMVRSCEAELGPSVTLADWGCGRQTVRRLIPSQWRYIPYDRIRRTADTRIIDFNTDVPAEDADVIFCLGLLEYVDDFWGLLGKAIAKSRFCVFSYVGPTEEAYRQRNGWKWNFTFEEVADFVEQQGGQCLSVFDCPITARVYLVRNATK